jgi:antitoxin component YwqK of YwqJK toxin-antitoxin module
MKKLLVLPVLLFTLNSLAQTGLTKVFEASCDCYVVTNHYDNGKVSATHQELESGKKNGVETVYYFDGKKQFQRTWKNGKLNGVGTHYHANGNVYYESSYANGEKSGNWTFKEDNGETIQVISYNGSKDDGTYSYYRAGVNYFTQVVAGGKMISENVLDQAIYDQLIAEAEAAKSAEK